MVLRHDLHGVLDMLYASPKITGLALMRQTDCGVGKNLVEVRVEAVRVCLLEGNWEGHEDIQGWQSLGVVREVRVCHWKIPVEVEAFPLLVETEEMRCCWAQLVAAAKQKSPPVLTAMMLNRRYRYF